MRERNISGLRTTLTSPEIVVSSHARDRYASRVIRSHNPRDVDSNLIRREVRSALKAGRVAKNAPRWLGGEHHQRFKCRDAGRFVWPTHKQYAYLIHERRDRTTVVTVFT